MQILAFDASAKTSSAAIVADGVLLGRAFLHTGFTHSETLLPMIAQLLENTGVAMGRIDGIAVSRGPGSFTGVRIGIATAKGLAFPGNIPCAGISTLEAMAYTCPRDGVAFCLMDARRGQVYRAAFRVSASRVERLCGDGAAAVDDLEQELKQYAREPVLLMGDGAALCYKQYRNLEQEIVLAPEHVRYQDACGVALAAQGRAFGPAAELAPVYLRLPQAQRELRRRQRGGVEQ
ncbi:MAG: tRNA (adenosine(37)-N6)-threonylcarbamoyltransferase complex dimerization subunit type 1 TsaB [Clostridiales bacterium]|nr:tRNA (adenosine(37)-N6)-threonylcarbamoyltransferase complex dimerization subunit type 1 TsaB [Clostridiales bacterium]